MPRIDQEQNINALIDSDIVQLVVKRPDDDALSMKQHITAQARRCTVAFLVQSAPAQNGNYLAVHILSAVASSSRLSHQSL